MNRAAACSLLAFILSNALVVANPANSTGYQNTVPHSSVEVGAILSESDMGANENLMFGEAIPEHAYDITLITEPAGKEPAAAAGPPAPEEIPEAPASAEDVVPASKEDVELLARIVSAEAKSEPYTGQVAVAAVVLNRVEEGFGGSIEEVIYAKGQFQPVSNGSINKSPVASAYAAAEEALKGADPTKGAVYFANMSIAETHPNPKAEKTVQIGEHTFYR